MHFALAASILGAREIGYWTTSDLIFDQYGRREASK
jgi:hypothetical protein